MFGDCTVVWCLFDTQSEQDTDKMNVMQATTLMRDEVSYFFIFAQYFLDEARFYFFWHTIDQRREGIYFFLGFFWVRAVNLDQGINLEWP